MRSTLWPPGSDSAKSTGLSTRTCGRTSTRSPGSVDRVPRASHRRQAGYPPDIEMAERWRHVTMDHVSILGMGTPQGAVVSPVLANVFLHDAPDLRFHKKWRRRVPEGGAIIVRHADDIVVGFQHKRDAEQYLCDVRERLARFGLGLHPDKTRLAAFGRFAAANRRARSGGQTGDIRLPGLHALLHDDQTRPVPARSQADREKGQQNPGTHRQDAPQAMASRHPGGRRVARAARSRLAQRPCRPRIKPVPRCVLPQAATPVDAHAAPTVPARPLQMEETDTHDQSLVASCVNPPPMAGMAVRRRPPEAGAGWPTHHVRICARGGGHSNARPYRYGHTSQCAGQHLGDRRDYGKDHGKDDEDRRARDRHADNGQNPPAGLAPRRLGLRVIDLLRYPR